MSCTKLAVVTGANKGVGYEIVKALCSVECITVYLTARNAARGQDAIRRLKLEGVTPLFHTLDVESPESITRFRNHLIQNHGGIDILVNNAGIAFFTDQSVPLPVQAEKTLATNYFGVLNVCRELFPLLNKHARVVNISSELGHLSKLKSPDLRNRFTSDSLTEEELTTLVNEYKSWTTSEKTPESPSWPTAYSVSKIAVTALTKIQARTLSSERPTDGILVNAVTPGFVRSDMTGGKGHYSPEEGARAPTYACLLPQGTPISGEFIWNDKSLLDWSDTRAFKAKMKTRHILT